MKESLHPREVGQKINIGRGGGIACSCRSTLFSHQFTLDLRLAILKEIKERPRRPFKVNATLRPKCPKGEIEVVIEEVGAWKLDMLCHYPTLQAEAVLDKV